MSGDVYLDGKLIGTNAVLVIDAGMGFAEIGALIHGALADPIVGTVTLDIEPGEYPGRKELIDLLTIKKDVSELRDLRSYLRHDPTKNVRRRRRK